MLDSNYIKWAYNVLLFRDPSPDEVEFQLKTHSDPICFVSSIFASEEIVHYFPYFLQEKLFAELSVVEIYQPIYGFAQPFYGCPKRLSTDRVDIISSNTYFNFKGSKILDAGCSLGYFSFKFEEFGSRCHGIDANPHNINICKYLSRINKSSSTFDFLAFDNDYVLSIVSGDYDACFVFSVLHHLIHSFGLAYVQKMMLNLFERINFIFVELANKSEDGNYEWHASLPENELEVFDLLVDADIVNLGSAPTHLGPVKRNLYLVKKKHVVLDGVEYALNSISFASFSGASIRGREYIDSDAYFILRHRISRITQNMTVFLNDCYAYAYKLRMIGTALNYIILKDFIILKDDVFFVFNKLSGVTLNHVLSSGEIQLNPVNVIKQLLFLLVRLHGVGFYHNDIRPWNIIYDHKNNEVYLIDFELSSHLDVDNQINSLRWLFLFLINPFSFEFSYPTPDFVFTDYDFNHFDDDLISALFICSTWNELVDQLQLT